MSAVEFKDEVLDVMTTDKETAMIPVCGEGVNILINSLGRAERLIPQRFTGGSLMTSLQSVQMSKKQQKVKVENKIRTKSSRKT